MKLSELVYEIVRDSISLPNNNFGYASFVNGDYSDKKDYRLQIAQVFNALNLGLSRLYSYDKIPYFIEETQYNNEPIIFEKNKGEIKNVVRLSSNKFEKIRFKILNVANSQKIILLGCNNSKIYIEYKKLIPQFNTNDLRKIELDKDNLLIVSDTNIDLLEEYNITNEMCNYLKEFAKSIILENIAPELANNHNIRAEQYLNGIENVYSEFAQTEIKIV